MARRAHVEAMPATPVAAEPCSAHLISRVRAPRAGQPGSRTIQEVARRRWLISIRCGPPDESASLTARVRSESVFTRSDGTP